MQLGNHLSLGQKPYCNEGTEEEVRVIAVGLGEDGSQSHREVGFNISTTPSLAKETLDIYLKRTRGHFQIKVQRVLNAA